MSIRDVLNRHPTITTCLTVLFIFLAAGLVVYSRLPTPTPKPQTQAFYTVDDGKTWFADSTKKIAPFDKEGKEAVGAFVFRCGKAEPYVAYLERMAPDVKKKVDEMLKVGISVGNAPAYGALRGTGMQRKRPGDANWVGMTQDYKTFSEMAKPSCKDGQPAAEVMPDIF